MISLNNTKFELFYALKDTFTFNMPLVGFLQFNIHFVFPFFGFVVSFLFVSNHKEQFFLTFNNDLNSKAGPILIAEVLINTRT